MQRLYSLNFIRIRKRKTWRKLRWGWDRHWRQNGVDGDVFGELPPSTIFIIKDKVATLEDTGDEDIETIQKGILTNLFLFVTYNYVLNITKNKMVIYLFNNHVSFAWKPWINYFKVYYIKV